MAVKLAASGARSPGSSGEVLIEDSFREAAGDSVEVGPGLVPAASRVQKIGHVAASAEVFRDYSVDRLVGKEGGK